MEHKQFQFEDLNVGYYHAGKGKPVLLIHGSGPGASSIGNWRLVLPALAEHYEVYAMDLVGFGTSDRKLAAPYFDYALWVRQCKAMLDVIGTDQVGIIGHSLSGSLALKLAATDPRIAAVLTTGTMGAAYEATNATINTWRCPTNREELITAMKGLIHDHSIIDETYLAAREPVLFAPGYADYFNQMFEGDPRQYIEAAIISDELLHQIVCPVTLLHGRNDMGFPPSSSIQIAEQISHADLVVLHNCSHSVAFERTELFLTLATQLFDSALSSQTFA